MSLLQEIEQYIPGNQQEEQDQKQMVWFIKNHSTTDKRIQAEFCPDNSGSPRKINTIPNAQNSFPIALLYFLISVTWITSPFALGYEDFKMRL